MEIYKLKDEVPKGRRAKKGKISDGERALRVTDLKQGMKNPNRVNVFINGKFEFSLDMAQVVDLGVKVGLVLTTERLVELKEASEFGKAYQRALEWVLMRPRSKRELKDYLRRREVQSEAKERKKDWEREREIADLVAKGEDINAKRLQKRVEKAKDRTKYDFKDLIMSRLMERGYVDDEKFARYYVENRFIKKGVSQKRLKMELMRKGVTAEIVEKVLGGRNDEEEILKIIAKKRKKYTDEKLVAYLCRQGFSYDLARELVGRVED